MLMMKVNRFFLLWFLILALISCGDNDLPFGHRAEAFKLGDSRLQDRVLAQMSKHKIAYTLDEEGFVNYLLDDYAEVEGMIRVERYGQTLSYKIIESKILFDQQVIDQYVRAFDEGGIPYTLNRESTHSSFKWAQVYGPEVDLIIESVTKKLMNEWENQNQ